MTISSEENIISGKCEVSSIVPPSPLGTTMQDIPVVITTRPDYVIQCPPVSRTLKQIHYVKKPPTVTTYMDVALINVRSINKNGYKVKDYVVDRDCDITAITETWLTDEQDRTTQIVKDLCPKGYTMPHQPRTTGQRGGGVGLLHKKGITIRPLTVETFESFEYAEHMLKQSSIWIRIIVLYRPPPSTENRLTNRQFLTEFSSFLERQIILPGELLLLGDFNIHIDDPNDYYAKEFQSLLETFDLTQLVRQATHKDGHILDLVITKSTCILVKDIYVTPPWVSDHSIVHIKLSIDKPVLVTKTITCRKWKDIDINSFRHDISCSKMLAYKGDSVSDLVSCYNKTMSHLLDKHAPLRRKTITVHPQAEWYTSELELEKRKRRRLERIYRKSLSSTDAQDFLVQCAYYSELLVKTRQQFYVTKIEDSSGDQRSLFKVLNKLLHREYEQQLPAFDDLNELVNRFADFFRNKIHNIRLNLQSCHVSSHSITEPSSTTSFLSDFHPVSEADVEKIIKRSSTKSCSLDPIPTWLLKDCLTVLLPMITNIINLSLSQCEMPESFKEAILIPLLKKILLDPEILKHFRPISNLAYVSKLIEMVVDDQVTVYMDENHLHELFQSAYKKFHSTETAMVRIKNDFLSALDDGNAILVVCLDLSAAFDTVDHEILLTRLEKRIGITGNCLAWFRSYLSNRSQKVLINDVTSSARDLSCGVPQGSVLGPKLFNVYTLPLGDIMRKHGIAFHIYADDDNLYLAFKPLGISSAFISMESLISDIRGWMIVNMLGINDTKTDFTVINGPRRKTLDIPSLRVGEADIMSSTCIKALGVHIDNTLSMKKQVNEVSRASFAKLSNMYKIRKCITEDGAKTMVLTMITSGLDYCNSLYYGLPDCLLEKLYCVQKSAARLITLTGKYEHITPVFIALHWLPIKERCEFKILLLTYKCFNGLAPAYLEELLHKRPDRGSRRDNDNLLIVPKVNRVTFGGIAFKRAAPDLWNSIPSSLRQSKTVDIFKSGLKTLLFKRAFNL